MSRLSGQVVGGAVGTRSIDPPDRPAIAAGLGDVDFRSAMIRLGLLVGWAAILAVLVGLVARCRRNAPRLLAGAHAPGGRRQHLAMFVPWHDWLARSRGRLLLDLWSGALIGFVALLVIAAGRNFALLLFLAIPFIAVVHVGRRRARWLAVAGGTCVLVAAIAGLPAGVTAMRSRSSQPRSSARSCSRERSSARRPRVAKPLGPRRVRAGTGRRGKSPDQEQPPDRRRPAAARPPRDRDGRAFDGLRRPHPLDRDAAPAARRERAADRRGPRAAREHRPLGLRPGRGRGRSADVRLGHRAEGRPVANELITNAIRHGAAPIACALSAGRRRSSSASTTAAAGGERPDGLGLQLVRRIVEHGLGGDFELGCATRRRHPRRGRLSRRSRAERS